MEKVKKFFGLALGIALVSFITTLTAYRLQLLTGFPKGVDAYAHLTRVIWILTRFPQIHWNPSWNSGTFFWLWSYPPSNFLLIATLVKVLGISAELALTMVVFGCMIAFALGFYLVLSSWAGFWLSIPIALLALTTPALYSWWGHGGNYNRIWGMGFYALTMAMLVFYLKKPRKLSYAFLIIFLGLTLSTHMLFTALMIASLVGYVLFSVKGFKEKTIVILKTLGVGILLSSFWYIPMIATTTGERFLEPSIGGPVLFPDLFSLNYQFPYFSLPLYFAIAMVVSILMAVAIFIWKRGSKRLVWGALPTFIIGVLGSLAYAFGRNFTWFPKSFSASGFAPFAAFPFIIIFTGFLLAAGLGVILGKYKNSLLIILISMIACIGVILLSFTIDFSKLYIYDVTRESEKQPLAIPPVRALEHDGNFRFGTDSAFVADWFNYFYPNLSQTRDYIYQGIPYKSWQYFQEYSLWTQDNKFPEAQWLLDWYGVKYFTVGFASSETKYDKFLSRPDLFKTKYANSDAGYYLFEYKKARPILTTSEAPAILMVGKLEDYDIFVRSLALAGLGTDIVIPVYGGEDLAKLKDNLSSFETLFLYRYEPSNSYTENNLIKKYLEGGGRILVEAIPNDEIQNWPSWTPVKQSELFPVEDEWEFTRRPEIKIIERDFSPPSFNGGPWKVSKGVLNQGAITLLSTKDAPVVVEKKSPKGTVIWSSLNLPYHAESYRNEKEVFLLAKLLGVSTRPVDIQPVELLKNEPQERIWRIEEKAKGLVWKESWFPRWTIIWRDSKGNKGKLASLMAGPALSYLPLPQEATYPISFEVRYHLAFWDYLGWGVTLLTIFVLIIYFFKGKFLSSFSSRAFTKISSWWDENE